MRRGVSGFLTGLFIILTLGGFSYFFWANADDSGAPVVIVPTDIIPTDNPRLVETVFASGFASGATPLPSMEVPTQQFLAPTLPSSDDNINSLVVAPATVAALSVGTADPGLSVPSTPTVVPITPTPLNELDDEGPQFTEIPVLSTEVVWRPPPLLPPLSRDPLGRDHYWLIRPIDSNANNEGLFYYPFGSDGPQQENPWRVHHGIDMSNPVGETVRAAGSGQVIWAADSLRVEGSSTFQNSPSYGNVVVVQHDFGFRGQSMYTLYAHLSAVFAERGQLVHAGDPIGLVGETGRVSGPHVHFEVRLGENAYRATHNPVLWMVPYVGHGVIAGRLLDEAGNYADDIEVTLRRWSTGLVEDTTLTYVFLDNGFDINPDPNWEENFVFGDIPVGRYEVIATVNGRRLSKFVDVEEGTTILVELQWKPPSTSIPADASVVSDDTGS